MEKFWTLGQSTFKTLIYVLQTLFPSLSFFFFLVYWVNQSSDNKKYSGYFKQKSIKGLNDFEIIWCPNRWTPGSLFCASDFKLLLYLQHRGQERAAIWPLCCWCHSFSIPVNLVKWRRTWNIGAPQNHFPNCTIPEDSPLPLHLPNAVRSVTVTKLTLYWEA